MSRHNRTTLLYNLSKYGHIMNESMDVGGTYGHCDLDEEMDMYERSD